VFVTSFAVAIVGVAVLATFVRNMPRAERLASPPTLTQSLDVLRLPDVRRVMLAAGALGLVTASDGLIYLSLQRALDLPPHALPLLFTGTSTSFLLLSIPVGVIADRMGRMWVFMAGHVALLLVYAVSLAPMTGMLAPLLVVTLLGAYYAATDGVLMALASPVLPDDRRGGGLALVATMTNLGRAGAAIAFGFAWATWSREWALAAFGLGLTISIVVATICLHAMRRSGA
jgi:predicted MFS family arabinose efflux permease